ncbi:MAG: carboxypeptidase regulatory-like domain-containing protein [Pirellulales bacterium]|nr:carboxypeptidase regulatory-like domain-containing protein [Pirellulales bacterium]
MKCTVKLRAVMLALACLGLIIPAPLVQAATTPADQANNPALQTIDVGLQKDSVLFGQVVDAQGKPQAKMAVTLLEKDRVLAKMTTTDEGYFAVSKVPAGTYRLAAGETQGLYRLWAPQTAPPAAQPGALLVVGQGPVRGQEGPVAYWMGKPLIVAGLIAAAVAIPVAIHNHQIDKRKTPTSP